MARRSSRRSKKTPQKSFHLSPATLRTLAGAGAVLLVVIALVQFLSPKSAKVDLTPSNFRIDDYRRDGSRFATPGNTYVLEAKVENIDTRGNDKLLSVSLPRQGGAKTDRLPLMLRDGKSGRVNVTRGDTFLFEVTCRNGQDEAGKPVKGILMVKSVHSK